VDGYFTSDEIKMDNKKKNRSNKFEQRK